MHTCPAVTGSVPHVGGPILPPCSPTVIICALPAARITDLALCVGPPDTIIRGAASVLINGLQAARLGDTTAHGGVIVKGCLTVIINDPPVTFPFTIGATGAARAQVQTALGQLYATPTGKQIIDGIAATGHTVTIEAGSAGSFCSPANYADSRVPGRGTNSTVTWDPSQTLPGLDPNDSRSSTVVLGHELVHADHNANGTNANGPNDSYPGQVGSSQRGEERSTVGAAPPFDANGNPANDAQGNPNGGYVQDPSGNYVPGTDYSHNSPTENSLRRDMGFPERSTYYPPNWPGGAPW